MPGVQTVQYTLHIELNPLFTTSTSFKKAQARPFGLVWKRFTITIPVL